MNIRRINRGIALGCVLAIGTACYVLLEKKQFSKELGSIETTVEEYLEEVASAQLKKQPQNVLDEYKNVLDEYWTESSEIQNNSYYYFSCKNDLTEDWDNLIRELKPTGYFEKCDIKIDNIKIKQYGNSGALATVDFNVACEFYGAPLDIIDSFVSVADNENYSLNGEVNTDADIKYKSNREYNEATIYLLNEDGAWKIGGISYFGFSSTTSIINDDEISQNSSAVDSDIKEGDYNE